ncbi:MAG TPA: sensor histidine kinase [Chitinophagaceae bacterium]|nr:sensor histidine kinase [Chitinophagaceae bacterium]
MLVFFQATAQTTAVDKHYTDSMKVLIQKAKADTSKALLFNKLSRYWFKKDTGKAASFARKALKLGKGYPYYSALANYHLGVSYYYQNPAGAQKYFQATIDLLEDAKAMRSLSLLSKAWKNFGATKQRVTGNNKVLMEIMLNHAIPLAQAAGDHIAEAEDYGAVALVYSNLLNHEKAILYYKKAIQIGKEVFDKHSTTLAKFYIRLAQNDMEMKQLKPVAPSLDSARQLLKNAPHSILQAMYFKTLGMYYARIQHTKQSLQALDTALRLSRRLQLPYMAGSVVFEKFRSYNFAQQYGAAKEVLTQVLHDSLIASKPRNKLRLLKYLAETNKHLGEVNQAYRRLEQYTTLADSLHKANVKSKVAELEVKYQSEKKQRKILSLQNKTQAQQLSIQENRLWNYTLLAGIIILLLICGVVYLLYRNKKRKMEQEKLLHQQKLKDIHQKHRLSLYDAMLEGQEQERQRLAQDLHDGLGGMLAGVKLKLSDIADHQKSSQDMELYKVINQLDNSVQELRRIAHNMMPETLLRFGVETALKDLCESLSREHLNIEFQVYQLDKELSQTIQISVYRIVQELLTNAVKHAHADNILVQCSQNENRIFITVEDDGQGFDIQSLKNKKGIGFLNIQKRIDMLHGKMEMDSRPREGTVINVEVNVYE